MCQFLVPEPQRGHEERAVLDVAEHHEHIMPLNHQHQQSSPTTATTSHSINVPSKRPEPDGGGILLGDAGTRENAVSMSNNNPPSLDVNEDLDVKTDIEMVEEDSNYKTSSTLPLSSSMPCSIATSVSPADGNNSVKDNNQDDAPVVYESEKATLKSTWTMLKTPTVILILVQGAPSVIPFGITSTFLNDYLAQDKGMAVEVRSFGYDSRGMPYV
jgi:hypothetical protein